MANRHLASADVNEVRLAITRTAKTIAEYQREDLAGLIPQLLEHRADDLEQQAAKLRKAAAILRQ